MTSTRRLVRRTAPWTCHLPWAVSMLCATRPRCVTAWVCTVTTLLLLVLSTCLTLVPTAHAARTSTAHAMTPVGTTWTHASWSLPPPLAVSADSPALGHAASAAPEAASTPDGNAPAQPVGAASFVFPDPTGWANSVFNQVLVDLGDSISSALQTLLQSVLTSPLNFITQTPPAGTYQNRTVISLWGTMRTVADAALALVVMWGGFQVLAGRQTGTPYHEAMELVPRVAVGALLANTSLFWGQVALDANNALCGTVGMQGLPGWVHANTTSQAIANVLATVIYLVTALLLLIQMLMRLALIDVLLIVAPLGLLCWVLPQTQRWAHGWSLTFCNAVFAQVLQVVALKLGASLLTDLTPVSPDAAVLQLLLGVAVLLLTLKVPHLLRVAVGDGLGMVRIVALPHIARAIGGAPGGAAGGGARSPHVRSVTGGDRATAPGAPGEGA